METLSNMNMFMLHNQSKMMVQFEDMQQFVHHFRDMSHLLMENQKISMPPYHFIASTSSVRDEPIVQSPPNARLSSLDIQFSPINLEEF